MPYAVPPAHFYLYKHTDTHVCIYTHTHTFMGSSRNSVRAGVLLDALQIALIAKVIRSISLRTFQDVHCMNPEFLGEFHGMCQFCTCVYTYPPFYMYVYKV